MGSQLSKSEAAVPIAALALALLHFYTERKSLEARVVQLERELDKARCMLETKTTERKMEAKLDRMRAEMDRKELQLKCQIVQLDKNLQIKILSNNMLPAQMPQQSNRKQQMQQRLQEMEQQMEQ